MFRVGVPKLQPPAAASSNTLSKSDASHKMLVFVSRKSAWAGNFWMQLNPHKDGPHNVRLKFQ